MIHSRPATAVMFITLLAISPHLAQPLQQGPSTKPVLAMTITEIEVVDEHTTLHKVTAVRSDGAIARSSLNTGTHNTGSEARNITLPGERKYVVIADAVRAMSTFYLDAAVTERSRFVTFYPNCLAPEEDRITVTIAQERILGFDAFRLRKTPVKLSAELEQHETVWRVPQLDCRTIRLSSQRIDKTGNVISTYDQAASSVKIGEPDPALFIIPGGYREVPPSQASRELREKRLGRPFGSDKSDERLLTGHTRMDQQYYRSLNLKAQNQ